MQQCIKILFAVCFLLGNYPASEFYMPTFRNTLSVPSSLASRCIHLLAYEDGTECPETSAYKIQTPGNYPEENIQHTKHGESLKTKKILFHIYMKLNMFRATHHPS